jgi:hypothetical protein
MTENVKGILTQRRSGATETAIEKFEFFAVPLRRCVRNLL